MDKRLLSPDFISNNMEYIRKELEREGSRVSLVLDTSNIPGIGVTYEVEDIEGGV